MSIWCKHDDCLTSTQAYESKDALNEHHTKVHSDSKESAGFCPCNILGDVKLGAGVVKDNHPMWFPPTQGMDVGLKVLNTLTGNMEPFVPGNGRRVLWYTCGPTVYDSCHMGHARAYLTFDILRRIMEDYFGYEVLYQINITDIDDKIILRSRRNKLLDNYEAKYSGDFVTVLKDCKHAIGEANQKLTDGLKKLQAPLPANSTGREADERAEQLKTQLLKVTQMVSTNAKVAIVENVQKSGAVTVLKTLVATATKLNLKFTEGKEVKETVTAIRNAIKDEKQKDRAAGEVFNVAPLESLDDELGALAGAAESPVKALLAAANDQLGAELDKKLGSTITQHNVFMDHARKFEKEYMEDMSRLGVKDPDVLTRVTEYVPQIIAYIKVIIDKGLAYASNGSVYLSINDFKQQGHSYRKLEPFSGDTSEEAMTESEGALAGSGTEKKNVNDFALWKASKPGEPEWDCPWGKGRPGWHIECSVVASDIMGSNMDVHAGGQDLKFPHHDNELAQSEAYYGHNQWVNYFFHAGHLHIKGLKMAKSLKNFIKIRQALEDHSPGELRMMFLLQNWHKQMNYSDQTVTDARGKMATFKNFFGSVKALVRENWVDKPVGWSGDDRVLFRAVYDMQSKVHEALCNNFDTVTAVGIMSDTVTEINKYLKRSNGLPAVYLVKKAAVYMTKILKVFGVVDGNEDIGWSVAGGENFESKITPYVNAIVDFRDKIRSGVRGKADAGTLLTMCDAIRDDTLVDLGVRCEDRADGASVWKLDDPVALRRDVEEKREVEKAAAAKKRTNLLEKKLKELVKWQAATVRAIDMFKADPAYTAFDETGMPTADTEGPIKKATQKKLAKAHENQVKAYDLLFKTANGDITKFLADLTTEIEALKF